MDIQLLLSIGLNVPTLFYSTGGQQPHGPDANEPFLNAFSQLAQMQYPPLVVSTSYGDNELDLDIGHLNAVNAKFAVLGLRGVSVLFASGDGG